ncbi:hypothetical protein [Silvibacterium acidisoli]|uniref:hypothetical protein n=1 Tax=Acidobacteriaceae bacterium ZG23-2 TaxID=2883246 RepID=UPI00406C80CF
MSLQAGIKVEKTEYKGWQNCYRVTNGEVELVITGDVGPRIMRFGFAGGQNLLKEFEEQLGKSGETEFQIRGGNRVWKAPEDEVATYAPDNVPVEITVTPKGLIARAPVEPSTGLQKEMEISFGPTGSKVAVAHRITNKSLFALQFAPWALTMMAPGGLALTGFPPRGHHPENLEASNPLVMWAYTDFSDKRWTLTRKYLALQQDPNNAEAQKIGHFNEKTWGAYLLNGELFLKQTTADASKTYPDFGCSFETFTNNLFLELETLGPLSNVQPGQTVELIEDWSLFRNVKLDSITDASIDSVILPLLKA